MCALCKEQNKPHSFTQIKLQELDYMKHFLPMESRIAKPPRLFGTSYIKSKLKTRVSVESLHLDNGNVTITDQDKAYMLST